MFWNSKIMKSRRCSVHVLGCEVDFEQQLAATDVCDVGLQQAARRGHREGVGCTRLRPGLCKHVKHETQNNTRDTAGFS